ncbi:MAG: hypothetical protein KKG47_15425 [Proteobacteria bacterium]|nr:hypothetical protein [Pseudomonadota bacterium]MBU1737979.1 hypothetical protein [Pseudomonadota bacterium]
MQVQGRMRVFFMMITLGILSAIFIPISARAFWPVDGVMGVDQAKDVQKNPVTELPEVVPGRELQEAISMLAEDLVASLDEPDPEFGDLGGGVIVLSFVDLKKLSRTSSFGRYLSEQLMGEMQRRYYRVVEIRKTASILMQERRGEYGLSRDPAETGSAIAADAMLTGTYTEADGDVMINARIVDNRNAVLLASATVVFRGNRLTTAMLSDRASLAKGKPGVVYLKKLEM